VLRCMLIGMAIGVVTEIAAYLLRLWIYNQPQTPIINVVVMFGFIMGGIACYVRAIGLVGAFAIAFVIGLIYEVANLSVLRWWYFPEERLGVIRGNAQIVLALALMWGVVPVIIARAQTALPKVQRTAVPAASRLERLNQRENQLVEKLAAVQQRAYDIEAKLAEIRAAKEMLVSRQAVRKPGAPDVPAQPTP